jgi:hypothetical protein
MLNLPPTAVITADKSIPAHCNCIFRSYLSPAPFSVTPQTRCFPGSARYWQPGFRPSPGWDGCMRPTAGDIDPPHKGSVCTGFEKDARFPPKAGLNLTA